MHLGRIGFLGGALCLASLSGQEADELLKRLERCGDGVIKARVERLRNGIVLHRWVKNEAQKQAKIPPEYLQSLATLAAACESDTATPTAIAADLLAKTNDCLFSGMARKVPVQIETRSGGERVSDWEVLYQWVNGKEPPPAEVRVPGVTPAKFSLPPGIYMFQARKDKSSSGKVNVPVAGRDTVVVQISVR